MNLEYCLGKERTFSGLLCVEVMGEGEGSQFLLSDASCTVSPAAFLPGTALFLLRCLSSLFLGLIYLRSGPSGNLEHPPHGEVICEVSSLNNIPLK